MGQDTIKKCLTGSGLRNTPQRHAVMAFLMAKEGHPTAAEIFTAVNRLDPRSSRATIYNNLRDLVQAGLVREVAVEGRAARFDERAGGGRKEALGILITHISSGLEFSGENNNGRSDVAAGG